MSKSESFILPHGLDEYFQTTPIGSVEQAISNNLYGINHRQTPGAVLSNVDQYGLSFFVRPQLNLSDNNIKYLRQFYQLLTTNPNSIQRYVRGILDPRLYYSQSYDDGSWTNGVSSPLIDSLNPFIPVMTNNLTALSGWPDITAPTYSSREGAYREVWSIVDGVVRNYESFDIDATFRNTKGDAIIYMLYIWLNYMAEVFEGRLMPYFDFVLENEIDYNTRIYRLVLDRSKRFITKVAATGASFPVAVSVGQFFDFNSERPYNDQSKDITVRFRSMGAQYQDEILLLEFNKTVEIFNPNMINGREKTMAKIPFEYLTIFNNRGYPYINLKTHELEWYVPKNLYAQKVGMMDNTLIKSEFFGD